MKNEWLINGIDGIDDSLIAESVSQKRSRRPLYFAAGAAAAVMLIGTGFLLGTNYMSHLTPDNYAPVADGGAAQTEDELSGAVPGENDGDVPEGGLPAITTAPATGGLGFSEMSTVPPSGAADVNAGGARGTGELCTAEVVPTGEPLTDEETTQFLESYGSDWARSLLIEEGLPSEALISTVGFYKVYAYGDRNEANLNDKFFPVIVDGKIRACLELFRYEGDILPQGMFGGNRWDTINNAISEHPGETFAIVCCGFLDELMIAPDGTAYQINYDSGAADRADFDLYSVYATEYNTFNLSEVIENGQYITVKF